MLYGVILRRGTVKFGKNLRFGLEEMGLTYVKLGQYLAMRFDLLPPEVIQELSQLFERARPVSFVEISKQASIGLGKAIDDCFLSFAEVPIASASVAQVHVAYTREGEKVAVKIQRPGIRRLFNADMRNLKRLASVVDFLGLLGTLSLKDMVGEFANYTVRELDFKTEGNTAERLRANAGPFEVVPRIHWNLSSGTVLTMEFIEGISLAKLSDLVIAGKTEEIRKAMPNLDIEKSLDNLAKASLGQMFQSGFFHADPHPGNILILDHNRIAFVDFGIFGELSDWQRETFSNYIENMSLGNTQTSFRYLSQMFLPTTRSDPEKFSREVRTILLAWYAAAQDPNSTIQEKQIGKYIGEMIGAIRGARYKMTMDTMLFWRALMMLDASALRLPGIFDLNDALRKFFTLKQPNIANRLVTIMRSPQPVMEYVDLVDTMPDHVSNALSDLTHGNFRMRVLAEDAAARQNALNQQTRYIVAALLAVSMIVFATATALSLNLRILVGTPMAVFILLMCFKSKSK
jgi:ubiquinone biosynthesis protein